MEFTIRTALASDTSRLVEIWLASVRATHTFLSEQEIQKLLPLVKKQVLPALELWVLLSGNEVIGFAGLTGNNLDALFIHPEHIGKGGGKMLVNHARQLKGSLVVDVNEQNPEAVKFYETVGFKVTGRSETDSGGRPYPILHMSETKPVDNN